MKRLAIMSAVTTVAIGFMLAGTAAANHAWGYHWARTSNPFTLRVVDSVTSAWDGYLDGAISDWSQSSVLDLEKETGSTSSRDRRLCRPVSGKIRVCNYTYGNNGWLGLAQIWVDSADHIVQAITKVNDTYFNTSTYNTPAWRRLVMCQEPGHALGLDHQDENFNNANLGSCMDYTNDPDGGSGGASSTDPSNEHPNQHDYDTLAAIYEHLDSYNSYTSGSTASTLGNGNARADVDLNDPSAWGRFVRGTARGSGGGFAVYVRELGAGNKLVTFVTWAE